MLIADCRFRKLWEGSLLVGMLLFSGPVMAQQPASRPASSKLAPTLSQTAVARQNVRVQVTDMAAFEKWAHQALPALKVRLVAAQPHLATLEGADAAALAQLQASPLVEFVDVAARKPREERQLNQANMSVNSVAALHRRYPALAGQGLTVSVKENPLDANDIDFKGRLVFINPGAAIQSAHSSIMATLIAGGGNSSPAGKGVAWQARITSSDYANLLPDDNAQLAQRGVSVQNHSYGTGIENYYGLEAVAYDAQSRQMPTLLHVFSSGNSGNQTSAAGPYKGLANAANLTGQFKMSKNSVSVGATDGVGQVASLSSRGPAYDGRIKPELVAFGDGGSSDAAALVSGISLAVQQAYRDRHSGALPTAALVKAALLNSADDAARPGVDFVAGFGQVDALGAVRTMLDDRCASGSVAAGQEQVVRITVPAGTQQLKATLAWTDAAAAANAPQALVNDIDLELVQVATGTRWRPWVLSSFAHPDSLTLPARRRADHLNNVEQITVAVPAAGTYELRVRGYAVPAGPQEFALAYEFENGFEWLNPTAERNVRPSEATRLQWRWAGPAATGAVEYKPVGATRWRSISSSANLVAGGLNWATPDTTTLAQVRCTTPAGTFVSDTFALARPLALSVGYVCSTEALLQWRRVRGATRYQLYRLGSTHLEPVLQTTDTLYALGASPPAGAYYAVAPMFRNRTAERSSTANLAEAGLNCYVRSFLALQPVADSARLQLELGSLYGLQAVRLQRREQGEFQTVQTISPVTATSLLFTDPQAKVGLNQYRVQTQTTAGAISFSQTEDLYVVRRNDLLVFPVPVQAGQALRVVGEPGEVLQISLYDLLGRFLRETGAEGTINELDTSGLRPGQYLLRARTPQGSVQTRRIVVY